MPHTWSTQRKLLASESGTQLSALNQEQPNVKPDVAAACLYTQTYCSFNSLHSGCFNCNGCFLSCWRLFHFATIQLLCLALRPCLLACCLSIQLRPCALQLERYSHSPPPAHQLPRVVSRAIISSKSIATTTPARNTWPTDRPVPVFFHGMLWPAAP